MRKKTWQQCRFEEERQTMVTLLNIALAIAFAAIIWDALKNGGR